MGLSYHQWLVSDNISIDYISRQEKMLSSRQLQTQPFDISIKNSPSLDDLSRTFSCYSQKDLSVAETNDSALSLSKITTDSEQEPENQIFHDSPSCVSFFTFGACENGLDCENTHLSSSNHQTRAQRLEKAIFDNFPELINFNSRRVKSFLQ